MLSVDFDVKRLSPQQLALLLLVLLVLWIASGMIFSSSKNEEKASSEPKLFQVRAVISQSRPVMRELRYYGITEAERNVELFSQTAGIVEAWHVPEGMHVAQGDLIVSLKVEDREARLTEAQSQVKQRTIDYEAAKRLGKQGFSAQSQQAQRRAELDTANARLRLAELEMERIHIKAPFDGVIERILVEEGELVDINKTVVARIVDHHPLIVRVDLTEFNRNDVREGQKARVKLADGRMVMANIRYVGTVGDADIRTFRVEMTIDNSHEDTSELLPSGMSVDVTIPVEQVMAHRISTSALVLDKDSKLGVKSADANGRVKFHPVRLVKSSSEGTWIVGDGTDLPEKFTLITLGASFVESGEEVTVALTDKPFIEQKNESSSDE